MNNSQQQPQPRAADVQALVPVETSAHALALVPTSIDGAYQLAAWLSNAQLLPPALRGKQADLFTMILAGMELGLPPMAALRGMYIVNGKPALESKTKAAICLQRGAAVYIKRIEHTPEATTWETLRRGATDPVRSRYTKKEAAEAGLLSKDGPWRNYPQRMISHRALGWLCDDTYPDIVLGVATAEDFDDVEQVSFRPIASVGAGVDLGVVSPPKADNPAATSAPQQATPAATPSKPASAAPVQLTEEEILEIIAEFGKHTTIVSLRSYGATRLAGVPDGAIRDRLAKAYDDQKELIVTAAENEK